MRGLSYYILLILLKTGVIHLYSVIDIGSNTIRLVRGAVGRMNEQSGVLVDIGGGSTELVFFRSREVISAQSLPIGSLNLFSRFVSGVIPEGK